ncbi:hypothetical protein [Corynebacterium confusum]|uniref:hypothetical protein n=1 Tax=Corynebacterium confusum TaxID=71254 RepID=UPI0025B36603|nr:hypothetical protein [Corynebacterium confusum]
MDIERRVNNVVWVLLSVAVVTFMSVSVGVEAQAEPVENAESSGQFPSELEILSTIDEYIVSESHGSVRFDAERAIEDGVDSRIVEIGSQANEMMADQNSERSDRQRRDLNPGNYGRWCGKNNSGPGEPINSLDRACMGHDHCLNIKRPDCDCDREFVNKLREIRKQYSGWARTYLEAAIVVVPRWHGCKV